MSAELERRQQQQAAGAEQSSNRLNLNSRSRRNTSSPREPVIHFGWLHFIFVLILRQNCSDGGDMRLV